MTGIKEQVKTGERTARECLADLRKVVQSGEIVNDTIIRWLERKRNFKPKKQS